MIFQIMFDENCYIELIYSETQKNTVAMQTKKNILKSLKRKMCIKSKISHLTELFTNDIFILVYILKL